MTFKTIRAQRRDYQAREMQDEAWFNAIKAENLGPESLHDLALIQRRRAQMARRRTNWVFAALMATILVGFIYYVGAPLAAQFNDGVRRAYASELAIHQDALDRVDERRDTAWAGIQKNAIIVIDDNSVGPFSTARLNAEEKNSAQEIFNKALLSIREIELAPSYDGDLALQDFMSEAKRFEKPAAGWPLIFRFSDIQAQNLILHIALRRSVGEVTTALDAINDRKILTQKRDTALQNLNEIRAGGFSLAQRRQDFRLFIETCREGGPGTSKKITTTETTDAGTIETYDRSTVTSDITAVCVEAYKAMIASEKNDAWEILAQRLPPALLLLFFLATLGPLYRYSLRLTGFHNARADFLEFIAHVSPPSEWPKGKDGLDALMKMSDILAADKVDFGKTNTPTDQAIELAKAIRSPS